MIHALECKHLSRGLAQINLRDNMVLLWCVIVLSLSTASPLLSIWPRRLLMMIVVPRCVHSCN